MSRSRDPEAIPPSTAPAEADAPLAPTGADAAETPARPETLSRPEAFEEGSFWRKLSRFAGRIGRSGVQQALTLYYAMRDPDTPRRAKATIAGVLGYLVVPIDAVPDVLIGVGYGDDLAALAFAASVVAMHVKKEHREAAAERLGIWFGPSPEGRPRGNEAREARGASPPRGGEAPSE